MKLAARKIGKWENNPYFCMLLSCVMVEGDVVSWTFY